MIQHPSTFFLNTDRTFAPRVHVAQSTRTERRPVPTRRPPLPPNWLLFAPYRPPGYPESLVAPGGRHLRSLSRRLLQTTARRAVTSLSILPFPPPVPNPLLPPSHPPQPSLPKHLPRQSPINLLTPFPTSSLSPTPILNPTAFLSTFTTAPPPCPLSPPPC
jgi:hypothetical protein